MRLPIRSPLIRITPHHKKRAPDAATASDIGRNETKRQYADTDTSFSACLFLYHTQIYLCVTTACRLKGVYVCI